MVAEKREKEKVKNQKALYLNETKTGQAFMQLLSREQKTMLWGCLDTEKKVNKIKQGSPETVSLAKEFYIKKIDEMLRHGASEAYAFLLARKLTERFGENKESKKCMMI